LTYIELIAYFRAFGNVRFECFGQKYDSMAWNRFEQEYELMNGNQKIKGLRANKNVMLVLKKCIEDNKCKIVEL